MKHLREIFCIASPVLIPSALVYIIALCYFAYKNGLWG